MAHYDFEGDVDNISERQLEFIKSVIVELGYKNSKVLFEPVGHAGDNYIASVKRITIKGTHGVFSIIAKIAPTLETIRKSMNIEMMFKNEHVVYTEILPKFEQFQKDAGVPEEEQLRYAKCYGSLSEKPHEVILLEDLKMSNFIMPNRFSSLTDGRVKSVLKNFAILHSLSFVLKDKDQDLYEHFRTSLSDNWLAIADMAHVKTVLRALEVDTLSVLKDPKHIDFLKRKVTNLVNLMVESSKADVTNKYTVIQQGDLTTNNVMFKGGKIIQSVMIDYQNSKTTSPASDLLYMLFNCTDHEGRSKRFYEWIDYYYSELDKSLSNFNLKADLVYPRDVLDADLKKYCSLMVGVSIFAASLLIRTTVDAAKVKEAMDTAVESEDFSERAQSFMVSSLDEESRALFQNRVTGLIESCIELELL